jgi:hypothetical protein
MMFDSVKTGRARGGRVSDCIITCRAPAPTAVKGGEAGAQHTLPLDGGRRGEVTQVNSDIRRT